MPEPASSDPLKGEKPSGIDRKKAQALLDNIQEDPVWINAVYGT